MPKDSTTAVAEAPPASVPPTAEPQTAEVKQAEEWVPVRDALRDLLKAARNGEGPPIDERIITLAYPTLDAAVRAMGQIPAKDRTVTREYGPRERELLRIALATHAEALLKAAKKDDELGCRPDGDRKRAKAHTITDRIAPDYYEQLEILAPPVAGTEPAKDPAQQDWTAGMAAEAERKDGAAAAAGAAT